MQPDSEVQDVHKKVQDQATSASEGASGGWQGWLTGWYSWNGTDTTDGRAPGTTTKNDTSQMFMGEPPTTKGKWNTGNQYTCASSTCKGCSWLGPSTGMDWVYGTPWLTVWLLRAS